MQLYIIMPETTNTKDLNEVSTVAHTERGAGIYIGTAGNICVNLTGQKKIVDGGATSSATTNKLVDSTQNFTSTVVIDNWYHLAVTHTGTTTTVYLNGTAITPSSTSGSAVAIKTGGSPQPLTIGLLQGLGSTYAFDGEIDQVRTFNKELTATEVLQVYTE